jgi:cytochrome b561
MAVPAMRANDDLRYGRVASALHWLIGIALLGQVTFGFLLDEIAPRGTPARGSVINLHKSFGIVLGLLIVLRLLWRLKHRPPAWPADMPAWQRRAAHLGHAALYGCMLVLPLSGYIASNFSKHGVKFFGIALRPWGPDLPAVYNAFNLLHVVTGFVFAALIVGHIAAALKHALVDRDAVFARIWPWAPSLHASAERRHS